MVPFDPPSEGQSETASDGPVQEGPLGTPAGEGCRAELPFSRGKVFCSLREYLAHLEYQGGTGLPWWRQTGPDRFERVTSLRDRAPEIATREQLMRLYGFVR